MPLPQQPSQQQRRRLRLFPLAEENEAAAHGTNTTSSTTSSSLSSTPCRPHYVRASLATVAALGCGAFGHVRIRAAGAGAGAAFLPARLVPCPRLSDEHERGVLLAAGEEVLAALGVAVGGHVDVEAVGEPPPGLRPGRVTLGPLGRAVPPAAVLNRAARGLLLAPGAVLLVSHLGLSHPLRVLATGEGARGDGDAAAPAAVLVGADTEISVAVAAAAAAAAGVKQGDEAEAGPTEFDAVDGVLVHQGVLEEAVALLKASADAAARPSVGLAGSLRMRGLLLTGSRGAGKTRLLGLLVQRLRGEGLRAVCVRGDEVLAAVQAEEGDEGGAGALGAWLERLALEAGRVARDGRASLDAPLVLVLDDADAVLLGGDDGGPDGGNEGEEDEGHEEGASPLGRNPALRALRRHLMGEAPGRAPSCSCWVLATRGSVGQGGSSGSFSGGGGRRLARRLAALQGAGLFDRALELPPLSEAERAAVLQTMLWPPSAVQDDGDEDEGKDKDQAQQARLQLVQRVAEATGGFLPGDLERLCRAAALKALARRELEGGGQAPRLCWTDFAEARREVGPAALGGLLQQQPPPQGAEAAALLSWASVGGYEEVKARLRQLIEWPLRYAATFERLGLGSAAGGGGAVTPGILLHGPSGCGKSLLARVLAAEAKANFVELPATEVFSPFLGDSEARLRAAFARARRASPCILFLDELDAMAAGREGMAADGGGGGNSSSGGVYARVLSTLLNEMDGVSTEAGGGGLVVLAATNRVEAVDAALLRPGRLQEAILVPLPRPEADYLPILQVAAARMPLGPDVDLAALVRDRLAPLAASEGGAAGPNTITPATLGALAREAALVCLREHIEQGQGLGGDSGADSFVEPLQVTARHFDQAVDKLFLTVK